MRFDQVYGASLLMLVSLTSCTPAKQSDDKLDPIAISKSAGFRGEINPEKNVFKFTLPRRDLIVSIDGVRVTSTLGLMAWASFTGTKQHAVLIGEVPLLETEVNGFLSNAIEVGVEVTALHNRFLLDKPRVMSLHFTASGDEDHLALAVGSLFRKLSEHRFVAEKKNLVKSDLTKTTFNFQTIVKFLWKGDFEDGAYRISTGRGTNLDNTTVGDSMGVNTWAAFAGSDDHATVNGDIAMLEYELKDVLKALIDAHISIVSIHTHLTKETPRVMFVHYWSTGQLEALAKGVHAALEVQKNFRGSQ